MNHIVLIIVAFFLLVSCSNKNLDKVDIIPVIKYSEVSAGKYVFTVDGQNIINYNWNFGDKGALSSLSNPIYTYRFNGEYIVTVIVQTQNGNTQKTHTIKEKIIVTALKTATPQFQLTLEADNRTITVMNPSLYLKKIEWEFIDKYEGTIKSNVNNAKHLFPWNVEHQVKMTATVEAKNGDTTYTDTQNVKITGNPPPDIVVGAMGHTGDRSSLYVRMDRFSKIYANLGDGNYAVGSVDIGNNKVSDKSFDGTIEYNFPYNGIFKAEITMVNPNGTTTKKFDIKVNSSKYNYQQSVTIPAEGFKYTILSSPTIRSVSTEKVKFVSEFYLKDEVGSYYNFWIYSTNSSSMVNGPLIAKINPVFNSLKTTAIYDFGSIALSGEGSGRFSFKLLSEKSNSLREFIFLRNTNEYGSILTENLTISKINNFSINSSSWYSRVFVESGKLGELINEVLDNNLFNYIDKSSIVMYYQHEPNLRIRF